MKENSIARRERVKGKDGDRSLNIHIESNLKTRRNNFQGNKVGEDSEREKKQD